MTTPAQRHKVSELLLLLSRHAGQLDYPSGDVRGSEDADTWALDEEAMRARLARGGRLTFDCSQCATQIFRWAGLKDPNGLDYLHVGYTGTMLASLPHYSKPGKAQVGALVIFGPGTGDHVAIVAEPGRDPILEGHGRPGFDRWRLSVQRTFHRPPVTFLSIAHL